MKRHPEVRSDAMPAGSSQVDHRASHEVVETATLHVGGLRFASEKGCCRAGARSPSRRGPRGGQFRRADHGPLVGHAQARRRHRGAGRKSLTEPHAARTAAAG